jgi:hypothetical protein
MTHSPNQTKKWTLRRCVQGRLFPVCGSKKVISFGDADAANFRELSAEKRTQEAVA